MQIILADVSMSLDNVLAVAGAAQRQHLGAGGGAAAVGGADGRCRQSDRELLERQRWIAWIGLVIVLYVAVVMIWHGAHEVAGAIRA